MASSVHGIPRTTLDVDLVVDMAAGRIEPLAAELSADFYADPQLIRECFGQGRAANLIHLATGWKFDLFPLGADPYSRMEFSRRSPRNVSPDGIDGVICPVASAEDTILRKLERYRSGGETSARQWNDILGVCRTVRAGLDRRYLAHWAQEIGVGDLLSRLLAEA